MHWAGGMCIPACTGQGGVCIPASTGQGGVCQGGLPKGGVCPGGGGVCPESGVVWGVYARGDVADTPPVNRMTDRCKNNTLRTVKINNILTKR